MYGLFSEEEEERENDTSYLKSVTLLLPGVTVMAIMGCFTSKDLNVKEFTRQLRKPTDEALQANSKFVCTIKNK
ncbi:hypothetical protein PR048_011996, partial [Dryococelus australis]